MTQVFDSLGWALLHSLWQGAIMMIVVITFRGLTKNSAPALRYAVQIVCLFVCLAAFLVTFGFYQSGGSAAVGFMPVLTEPVSGGALSQGVNLLSGSTEGITLTSLSVSEMAALWAPIFGMLWCLGFIFMSARYFAAYRLTQKLRRRGLTDVSGFWKNRFRAMALSTGVPQTVRLYISDYVSGPLTIGFLKPVVLVPAGFLTGLPRDQVEAILLHELAHIRRYDYLVNLFQTGIKTVLFFHPAVHFISAKIDIDREQACDDLAVAHSANAQALVRGLAALRLHVQANGLAMAAKGAGKDTPLLDRLKRLADVAGPSARSKPIRNTQHVLMPVLATLLMGGVYFSATSVANAHLEPAAGQYGQYGHANADYENYRLETARINDRDITVKITDDNRRWALIDGGWVDVDRQPEMIDGLPMGMPQMPKFKAKFPRTNGQFDSHAFESQMNQFEVDIDYFEADFERYLEANSGLTEREKERLENRIERQVEREEERAERMEERFEDEFEHLQDQIERDQEAREAQMEREQSHREVTKALAKEHAKHSGNEKHQQYTDMREVLYDYVTADGYVSSRNETVEFTYVNDNWHVNGTPVARSIEDKYCELFRSVGLKKVSTTKVQIKPGSTHVSTQSKDHKPHRVTIGRHVHKNGEIHDPQATPAMPAAPEVPNHQSPQAAPVAPGYPQITQMNYVQTQTLSASTPQFAWPVTRPDIAAGFGSPDADCPKNHTGLDLKGALGAPVLASADGIVHLVTTEPSWGHRVIINHAGGYQSVYAHLNGFSVRRGQTVRAGDVIASIGATGKADKPHLHFEIHKDSQPIDPAQLTQ